jgi:integrase
MMSRRGQGEGTIRQRKLANDKRWEGRIDLGYIDGKRKRKAVYGKTRKEVQDALRDLIKAHQRGKSITTKSETTAVFLTKWLETIKPTIRPMTYRSYEARVHQHIIPTLGRVPVQQLKPQQVQALLNEKAAAKLSASTVRGIRAVLRVALQQGVKWQQLDYNAAALADPPRLPDRQAKWLDVEQAKTFLDAVAGDRLEALYRVAVSLGLRQGEALGLRWDDVDLEGGQLRVSWALQRVNGHLELVEPKTKKSRRTIMMPVSVADALRQHRGRQVEERLAAGSEWQEQGFVFTTLLGTPLEGTKVTKVFQGHLVKAGLPQMRFHDLRHSCASLLDAQGIGPRTIMEILGHSQISVTMNLYTHVMPSLMRDAADAMDRALS